LEERSGSAPRNGTELQRARPLTTNAGLSGSPPIPGTASASSPPSCSALVSPPPASSFRYATALGAEDPECSPTSRASLATNPLPSLPLPTSRRTRFPLPPSSAMPRHSPRRGPIPLADDQRIPRHPPPSLPSAASRGARLPLTPCSASATLRHSVLFRLPRASLRSPARTPSQSELIAHRQLLIEQIQSGGEEGREGGSRALTCGRLWG
jgi:hypothetical protein